jgi:hypothetical protein
MVQNERYASHKWQFGHVCYTVRATKSVMKHYEANPHAVCVGPTFRLKIHCTNQTVLIGLLIHCEVI